MSKDYLAKVVKDFEGVSTGVNTKMDLWVDTGSLALNKAISGSY